MSRFSVPLGPHGDDDDNDDDDDDGDDDVGAVSKALKRNTELHICWKKQQQFAQCSRDLSSRAQSPRCARETCIDMVVSCVLLLVITCLSLQLLFCYIRLENIKDTSAACTRSHSLD